MDLHAFLKASADNLPPIRAKVDLRVVVSPTFLQ
jgi:hypothetical protein